MAQNAFQSFLGGMNYKGSVYPSMDPKKKFTASMSSNPIPMQSKPQGALQSPFGASSATSPVKPSPAKAQFVQNLANASLSPVNPAISGNATTPSGAIVDSKSGSLVQAPQQDPRASYEEAYRKYISSLQPDEETEASARRLSEMQLGSEKAQADALYAPGDTLSGAETEASNISRNRSFGIRAEADRLSALTGRRNALTEAQKARVEFEKSLLPKEEAFTLEDGQVRYDSRGNVIAGGGSSTPGSYVAGANPAVDAYVKMVQGGQLKLDGVPTAIRGAVAQGLASSPATDDPKKQYTKSQADEALTNIDIALGELDKPGIHLSESALGRAIEGIVPGSPTKDLNSALTTVKALIGFDALQKMRESSPTGGALGQITERELAFLQSVAGSLDTMQGTPQLQATLNRIRQSFQTLQIVNSPDGTPFELKGQVYIKNGNEMIPQESFNSAGNASASNLPQRNNNPGNIKSGGLADSLAVGKDAQGHLIFPSADVGFQALQQDLRAKIDGRSRNLPPNPTLAQLGSVYAEDPKWATSVAKILGVSTSSKTASIDFNKLLQAVARQEGFYA